MLEVPRREIARSAVLSKLGLSSLVSTSSVDISASPHAHVIEQLTPARFAIDGLAVETPAGVYHPTPHSSSELFLRNLKTMDQKRFPKVLEIGAGCGAISLYLAAHWDADVTATDISPLAIEAIRRSATLNGLNVRTIRSDMFEGVREKDFDLVIFNAPLIDKYPENEVERYRLCDPGGRIAESFLCGVGRVLKSTGLAIVSVCCNSAYAVFDRTDLKLEIIGFELSSSGFWWAIVGARR